MSLYFPAASEGGKHTIFGNVSIRTLTGQHLQMAVVDLPADSVVEWHQHPQEQMGIMISGEAMFYIGDESRHLKAGDIYYMPGGVRHRVVSLNGPSQAVDFFAPIREEYR